MGKKLCLVFLIHDVCLSCTVFELQTLLRSVNPQYAILICQHYSTPRYPEHTPYTAVFYHAYNITVYQQSSTQIQNV